MNFNGLLCLVAYFFAYFPSVLPLCSAGKYWLSMLDQERLVCGGRLVRLFDGDAGQIRQGPDESVVQMLGDQLGRRVEIEDRIKVPMVQRVIDPLFDEIQFAIIDDEANVIDNGFLKHEDRAIRVAMRTGTWMIVRQTYKVMSGLQMKFFGNNKHDQTPIL